MPRRNRRLALAALAPLAAIAAACAAPRTAAGPGATFDLPGAVASLARTKDALDQSERLLRLAGEAERPAYRRRLAAVADGLADLAGESAAIAAGLRESFVRRFEGLPAVAGPRAVAGVRHRPLREELPENLVAVVRDGRLEISRTGGGPPYEACLEPGIPDGGRAVVRFRLQTRWSEGIVPVPYLGVRDGQGLEEVLVFLPEDPDPEQVHVVYLERSGGTLAALADDRVRTVDDGRLDGDARVFFQVAGTARIVVEEYRVTPPEPR